MDSIQWVTLISGLMGGLGLFLYGMKLMSEGLQKTAGNGLRTILEKLTTNRVMGTFVGMLVTAVIQSSSATTVMVVGFVNAGLMNLAQALSVVLGANVGTTITAQLIAFKIGKLALPAIGIGVGLRIFSKDKKRQFYGEILMGFGMLFLGLDIMKHAFVPLKGSVMFRDAFIYFSQNPVMSVFAGAILTMIVQSSSATIGITIALASTGLIDFYAASALVLGENIGTTITANLAAIGTNRTARRAALGHLLLNVFGVIYMLVFLKYFMGVVDQITPGDPMLITAEGVNPYISRHIANVHTLFNIINTLVFLPLLPFLAKACEKLMPGEDSDAEYELIFLDDRLVETPSLAISQARKEVKRMADTAVSMVDLAREAFKAQDLKLVNMVYEAENTLDRLEKDISNYLVQIFQKPNSEEDYKIIMDNLTVLHDIEKIGDYAENIARFTERIIQNKQTFSDAALAEMDEMFSVALRFARNVFDIFHRGNFPRKVDTTDENLIDQMKLEFKNRHMQRLHDGKCTVDNGIIFVDILNNLEKTGDQVFNVAQVINGNHHR